MTKSEDIQSGVVIEALPGLTYKVELPSGKVVRAYMSGRMRQNRIKVLIGDKVDFVVDRQGSNNRIVKRL